MCRKSRLQKVGKYLHDVSHLKVNYKTAGQNRHRKKMKTWIQGWNTPMLTAGGAFPQYLPSNATFWMFLGMFWSSWQGKNYCITIIGMICLSLAPPPPSIFGHHYNLISVNNLGISQAWVGPKKTGFPGLWRERIRKDKSSSQPIILRKIRQLW